MTTTRGQESWWTHRNGRHGSWSESTATAVADTAPTNHDDEPEDEPPPPSQIAAVAGTLTAVAGTATYCQGKKKKKTKPKHVCDSCGVKMTYMEFKHCGNRNCQRPCCKDCLAVRFEGWKRQTCPLCAHEPDKATL